MKNLFLDKLKLLPMEMKILVFAGIGGIIFSIFTTIGNILLGLSDSMILITILTGIIGAFAVYFALLRNSYKVPSYLALITLILIIYPFMWINNAGSFGTIAFFMISNAVFCSLLLRYLNYKVVLITQILVMYALLYIEYLHPEIIVPYSSEIARLIDIGFSFTLVFLFTFFLVYKIMNEYNKNIIELENVKKELLDINSKLLIVSETDELTGTRNRRYVLQKLERILLLQDIEDLSIIMMDIDHFKTVNDAYGHSMGDEVLKLVSVQIRKHIRRDDILGRIGGEEFLVVLQNTPLEDACHKAEELRQNIENMRWDINDFHVTISGGVYSYKKGDSLDEFLDNADQLLYQAKNSGRNKMCWQKK
jgi:diguanylate cyclase (GGDEF)-like protein